MYVAVVPNRGSRPAILLRESYRDGDKVKNRTLKNLSDWPAERIQLLRAVLRGETLVPAGEGLAIVRALPHRHVSAALGTARRIGLDRLLPRRPERRRKLALALIVARLIDPAAKLATARALDATTAIHSLGATLGLGVGHHQGGLCGARLAGPGSAGDREGARQAPSRGRLPRPLRSHLELSRGPLLRAGALRLQPRRSARQAADRPRAVVRRRRLPDRGRGVRRRYRRSVHARRSDCQDQGPLRVEAGGAGRRPRPTAARCSCRCSTSAIWPRSKARTIRASASSSAATRRWPRNARASEANCSPPPNGSSSASRPAFAALASRSRALPPSARRRCRARPPQGRQATSASPSATTILRLPAMTPASPPRRRSTASMSCAPPCRPRPSMPAPPCARIRAWLRSSAPSVR